MSLSAAAKEKLSKFKFQTKYLVVCDSCLEVFGEMSVAEYLESKDSGFTKDHWYIKAGYHWVEHEDHEINVYLVMSSGERKLVYALSQDWREGLKKEADQSKAAMIRELQHLESGLP